MTYDCNNEVVTGRPDVVLLPTYERVLAYRKAHAARDASTSQALFGTEVLTPNAWFVNLWTLYGDGRKIISRTQRELLLATICKNNRSVACVAVECIEKAAGLPEFNNICLCTEQNDLSDNIVPDEICVLETCAQYRALCMKHGLIEMGEALMLLVDELPVHPVSVYLETLEALPLTWQRFFDSCPQLSLDLCIAPKVDGASPDVCASRDIGASPDVCASRDIGASSDVAASRDIGASPDVCASRDDGALRDGMSRAPADTQLRFAFPAGRYAQAALFADMILKGCTSNTAVVIASKDPMALYEEMCPLLSQKNLFCGVQAKIPFVQTDFGRACVALRRFIATPSNTWSSADLTDFLFTAFSGVSLRKAYDIDARIRANRLTERDDILLELREHSMLFTLMEELVSDPGADIVLGAIEDALAGMRNHSEAWQREQRSAIAKLREVYEAARMVGAEIDVCFSLLEKRSITVLRTSAPANVFSDVFICDYETVAALPRHSCDTVIAADLTSEAFPISDAGDASRTLLTKIGIPMSDDTLLRMCRIFMSLVMLPRCSFVASRPLHDENAEPSYPAAVFEEFVDTYRDDPSATDDINNIYALPACLSQNIFQRGEDALFENATGTSFLSRKRNQVALAALGEMLSDVRDLLVLPRVLKKQVVSEPCLSPSQIETYLECPYKWFAARRMRLEPLDEGFGALEMGDFAHGVLCSFYRHFQEETGALKVSQDTLSAARSIMAETIERHLAMQHTLKLTENRLLPATELENFEVENLKRQLMQYLNFEVRFLPTYHPVYLEYDIAHGGAVDYAGHKLVGKADRIDADAAGHVVVIDYKASLSGAYALHARTPENRGKVQALIYAQVIRRELGLESVAALYVRYGKVPGISGAYDPRTLASVHLPAMKHDSCAWVPQSNEPSEAVHSENTAAFSCLLDETEAFVADAIERLLGGDIAPNPASRDVCGWCPVTSCPKRGA